jgi:hypothetical protein
VPWRDVYKLIDFRNYLTHAKTEWVAARALRRKSRKGGTFGVYRPETPRGAKIERQIRALIQSDNSRPLEGYPHEDFLIMPYFPFNRLTSNFAKMAVISSIEFHNEFTARMGIKNLETQQPLLKGTLSSLLSL